MEDCDRLSAQDAAFGHFHQSICLSVKAGNGDKAKFLVPAFHSQSSIHLPCRSDTLSLADVIKICLSVAGVPDLDTTASGLASEAFKSQGGVSDIRLIPFRNFC